jgi:hypothetical protein
MNDIRYPIGTLKMEDAITSEKRQQYIDQFAETPLKLRDAVRDLSSSQLDTPYRPEGWTIRQVAHHLADSHMNSYIRFKWALTEKEPVIKAYFEERWAELEDSRSAPVGPTLDLLKSLHHRWTLLLRTLSAEDRKRIFIHPEGNRRISLEVNMGIYAWHSKHHYAHIENLMKRKGWL